MAKILILGATSAIAKSAARSFAGRADQMFLVARDATQLEVIKKDISIRGASSVDSLTSDLTHTEFHPDLFRQAAKTMGGLDTVLIAHGNLPDQADCQSSFESTLQAFEVNCLSHLSLLTAAANHFETRQQGTIVAITSVAGDRGRKSNYVYGSAKAAVNAFLEGLRHRLHGSNVHIITVKPGLVDTPMTAGFEKGLLWAQPDRIGKGIVKAIDQRKEVVYLPGFWRLIMLTIMLLPRSIFKRLNF
ncbi:MAG: short-chain dehydrogenase [Gammaproteobacteria bacterium]|nr:MAG: short-chain dehydrogenase [Gammaproteobacteria bacterium]